MNKPPFLRTPYNYDMLEASNQSAIHCKDESKAKQSFALESDINEIVRRFNLTGKLPDNIKTPAYGDYTEIFDFQSAMNVVRHAQESFNELPAHIRTRFHNDPQELLEFSANPDNQAEAIKLGLSKPPPADEPPAPPPGEKKVEPATKAGTT